MIHYDKVSADLVKIKNLIAPDNWHSYTEVHFSEDWISRKDFDWSTYLWTLLDNVQDLKTQYLSLISLQLEENGGFIEQGSEIPIVIHLATNEEEFEVAKAEIENTIYERYKFSKRHLNLIENLVVDIQKCFKFFEENKDLPPYSEKVLSIDKIPFWGDQMEFTLLLHLLFESDFIPIRKNGVRKFKTDVSTDLKKQFESHKSLTKKNAIELSCTYFKGVTLEKNLIKEHAFKPGTVNSKMDNTSLSTISSSNFAEFEEKLSSILEHFKAIKETKELPSNLRFRST
ncbi:hypothetical protein [Algoriphagus aquimarinus]|uniref:Uncharacterized protein n=1 Tax=Algoriphagus aquimarinus TaxID=237018 RepID=A0A1I1CF26_9BACT|nr:hypothetical protein [Algoriphagus aquimarinus]SFB59370.1 hypothetical protein SAMN04489723_1262 [Algoriphagus aquimarinus]